MSISLSPITCNASKIVSVSNEDTYSLEQRKQLIEPNVQLNKLIYKHASRDAVPRFQRLCQHPWLSAEEQKELESHLYIAKWLVHTGLHCAQALEDLCKQAEDLQNDLDQLPAETAEEKRQSIQKNLESIYTERQKICSLLDKDFTKEGEELYSVENHFLHCEENLLPSEKISDEKYAEICQLIQKLNNDLPSIGLLQQMDNFSKEKLSLASTRINDQSLWVHFITMPKMEQFILCIASIAGGLGFFFHFPMMASAITILGILPSALRLIKLILEIRSDAKTNDTRMLDTAVIQPFIEIMKALLDEIFPNSTETSTDKQDTEKLQEQFEKGAEAIEKLTDTIEKLEEKIKEKEVIIV